MFKVNTTILFQLLIKYIRPGLICDIGSMDASHSIIFRKILPQAKIIAFEANPVNADKIRKNSIVKEAGIELKESIVSNHEGTKEFNIQLDVSGENSWRKGSSSLLSRREEGVSTETVSIESHRLDNVISDGNGNIVLWIDVEGAAYEVLEGSKGVMDKVACVHVEVETEEVWDGQRLKEDVDKLMRSYGFVSVARGKFDFQHDVVYLNKELCEKHYYRIKYILVLSKTLTMIRKWGGHILGDLVILLFIPEILRKPIAVKNKS